MLKYKRKTGPDLEKNKMRGNQNRFRRRQQLGGFQARVKGYKRWRGT